MRWTGGSNVDYVVPVRDQLNCGSCYAFAAVDMIGSRLRVNRLSNEILSPQQIVSCSQYSQGCDGGFPFLVSKYGMDFGLVSEACFPYASGVLANVTCQAKGTGVCPYPKPAAVVAQYDYVGGYFGACSEEAMLLELYHGGPLAVSFEVYPDFVHYRSGIYHHVPDATTVNPWEETNHAVLLVGWGVDDATGTKYWIVKNSWGFHFGLGGYFMIRRGTDECAIESMAVRVDPVRPAL